METYTLNPNEINKELNEKIHNNYIIKKITIICNDLIIDTNNIKIVYCYKIIDYFPDFIFFNNQIIFNCNFSHNGMSNHGYFIHDNLPVHGYFKIKGLDVKSIIVEIYKSDFIIVKDENDFDYELQTEENDIIIYSNYFTNIDELKKYYMDISNMTTEEIDKYLFNSSNNLSFNKKNHYEKTKLIYKGKSFKYINPVIKKFITLQDIYN